MESRLLERSVYYRGASSIVDVITNRMWFYILTLPPCVESCPSRQHSCDLTMSFRPWRSSTFFVTSGPK